MKKIILIVFVAMMMAGAALDADTTTRCGRFEPPTYTGSHTLQMDNLSG